MQLTKELLVNFHLECDKKVSQFTEKVKFDCDVPINSSLFIKGNDEENGFYVEDSIIDGFNGTYFYYLSIGNEEYCLVNFEGLSLDDKLNLIEEYLSSKSKD